MVSNSDRVTPLPSVPQTTNNQQPYGGAHLLQDGDHLGVRQHVPQAVGGQHNGKVSRLQLHTPHLGSAVHHIFVAVLELRIAQAPAGMQQRSHPVLISLLTRLLDTVLLRLHLGMQHPISTYTPKRTYTQESTSSAA